MGVINNQGTIGGGIASLREGLQLIQQPGLRRFVWVPLLVNILFLGLSLYLLTAWFDTWLDGWLATLPTWLAWLEGFLQRHHARDADERQAIIAYIEATIAEEAASSTDGAVE